MNRFRALCLLVPVLLLGCARRAEREALRQCRFDPVSIARATGAGDSARFVLSVVVSNPGTGAAVLDPFQATVDVGGPFGTIVQDRTLRLSPGRSDTARIALAAPGSDILARLIGLAFSPPDSVRIHGSARVPGLLFGTSEMPFRFAAPWSEIAPRFQGLLHGGN
jgi:hypothetical protein